MIQANKSFLEQQVRLVLKEQEYHDMQMTYRAARPEKIESTKDDAEKKVLERLRKINGKDGNAELDDNVLLTIGQFIIEIFFGSFESWSILFGSVAESAKFGFGYSSYINSIIDKFEKLDAESASLLPFLDLKTSDDKYHATLNWRKQLFQKFYQVCDKHAAIMLPLIKKKNKDKLADSYKNFLEEMREDVLEEYSVSNAEKAMSWAFGGKTSAEKFGNFFNERQLNPEDLDAKRYSEYLISANLPSVTKDTESFAAFLEQIVVGSHKYLGSKGKDITKLSNLPAYVQSQIDANENNIPMLFAGAAHMKYLKATYNPISVLIAITDIVLSVVSTIMIIKTLGASKAIAAPIQKIVTRSLINRIITSSLTTAASNTVNIAFYTWVAGQENSLMVKRLQELHGAYWSIVNDKQYKYSDVFTIPNLSAAIAGLGGSAFDIILNFFAFGDDELENVVKLRRKDINNEAWKQKVMSPAHKKELLSLILYGRTNIDSLTLLNPKVKKGEYKELYASAFGLEDGIIGSYKKLYENLFKGQKDYSELVSNLELSQDLVMKFQLGDYDNDIKTTPEQRTNKRLKEVEKFYENKNKEDADNRLEDILELFNAMNKAGEVIKKGNERIKANENNLEQQSNSDVKKKNMKKEFESMATSGLGTQGYMRNVEKATVITTSTAVPDTTRNQQQPAAIEPSEIYVAGDSIAVGLKRAGAKSIEGATVGGSHTWQVLRDLKKSLQTIQEQKSKKILYVSAGVNDALAYAITSGVKTATKNGLPRGMPNQPFFTPEITYKEIDKIAALAKSKGYDIKFRLLGPTPFKGNVNSGMGTIDPKRFDDFCQKVNSHMATKGYSTFSTNVQMKPDGIHPTESGYASLFSSMKSADPMPPAAVPAAVQTKTSKSTAKDDMIIIGDSNAIAMAEKWNEVPYKTQRRKRKGEDERLVFLQHKSGEIISPVIGSGQVDKIYEYVKKFYTQKGEQYKPTKAILHMGYNGPRWAFEPYKKTIDFLRVKGVSDIRVIALKVNSKHKSSVIRKLAADAEALNLKLRTIQGINFIENPGINSSDGYHFTNINTIYQAAMSGISLAPTGTTTTKPKPAVTTGQSPDIGGVHVDANIQDRLQTAGASEPAPETIAALQKMMKKMGMSEARYNNFVWAIAKKESGGKNNAAAYQMNLKNARAIINRRGNMSGGSYIGKFQIGHGGMYRSETTRMKEKYNLPDSIIPAGSETFIDRKDPIPNTRPVKYKRKNRMSRSEYVEFVLSPEGFQAQELIFMHFASQNYGGWIGRSTIRNATGFQGKERIGLAALAHNTGGPSAQQWNKHRENYKKTKNEKYLKMMWAIQDGNGTPGENFYRDVIKRTYGYNIPRLPMGNPRGQAKYSVTKKTRKNGTTYNVIDGARGDQYWDILYPNKKITDYYDENGVPKYSGRTVGDASAAVSEPVPQAGAPDVQVSASPGITGTPPPEAAAAVATGAPEASPGPAPEEEQPAAVAETSLSEKLQEVEEFETLREIIVGYMLSYGPSKGQVRSNVIELENIFKRMTTTDSGGYQRAKFEELTKNVHQTYRETFRGIYNKEKVKDEKKANEMMAFLHRPRIIVGIETDRMLFTNKDDYTLSFELGRPYGNQVGVVSDVYSFFSPDKFGNNIEKQNLKRIISQNKELVGKFRDKTRTLGPGAYGERGLDEEDKDAYLRYFDTLYKIYSLAEDALEPGGSMLRKALFMDNFASTLYLT